MLFCRKECRGHVDQPGRTETVVQIFVGFVSEDPIAQRGDLAGTEVCNGRVPPETELSGGGWDLHADPNVDVGPVVHVNRAAEGVLGPPAIVGRTEAVISPSPGPSGRRIDFRVEVAFLVADQSAVSLAR